MGLYAASCVLSSAATLGPGMHTVSRSHGDACSLHSTHRAPDVAKVKAKMMYASTKDFFKGLLDGISGT